MTEFITVAVGRQLSYDGKLDFRRLWRHIRTFMEARGYTYAERDHQEVVRENGKDVSITVHLSKELADRVVSRISVTCKAKGLTREDIEQDGKLLTLDDGHIELKFECYVLSIHEGRFAEKEPLFFMRRIIEKVFHERHEVAYKRLASQDCDALIKEVKGYLHLFTY